MGGSTKARDALCIKMAIVDGAGANVNMAITGIVTGDEIISVMHFTTKAAIGTLLDQTATTHITTDGNIQCTVDTTNDQLVVHYLDTSA